MKKIYWLIIGSILTTFLVVLFGLNFAKAAVEPVELKISPVTFKFQVEKAGKISEKIYLTNPNDFELKIKSEVEDFLQGDEEGTPRFIPQGTEKTTLSSWVKVGLSEFVLAPFETKEIPFEINAPKDAEPGGHYAAIFFKTVPEEEEETTRIGISSRVGALVLVSVPGDVSQTGEIVEFRGPKFVGRGPVDFLARFKNTGTVHYQLGGEVKITNWLGKETAQVILPEHIVLPDSIRKFEAGWERKYPFGRYTAELQMVDGGGNLRTAQISFFAFPWQETAGLIVILIVVWFVLKYVGKKYQIVKK